MISLYELSAEIRAVLESIMDDDTDSAEVDALLEELDALHAGRDRKLEGYAHVIRNSDATAKALREEAKAFIARAVSLEKLSGRLKARAQMDMESHGETAVTAGQFTFRRQASPPSVEVQVPVEALPVEFHKVVVSVDKTALKEALSQGRSIEGAELRRGEHIRIRLR